MRAASKICLGTPSKYMRKKNIVPTLPKSPGTMSGSTVPVQPIIE